MTAYNAAPIRFAGISQVTASLGANDPQLGDECQEGGNGYIYVYNSGNSQVNPGYGMVVNPGATGYSCTISSVADDLLVGVVRNATITTGTYGWVVKRGYTPVQMHADISAAAGAFLDMQANGVFGLRTSSTPTASTVMVVGNTVGKITSATASNLSGGAFVFGYA